MAKLNLWIVAGWLVFVCSFVVPAYGTNVLTTPGEMVKGMSGDQPSPPSQGLPLRIGQPSLSGWNAMNAAFDGDAYAVVSATTNILIVLTLLSPWSRKFASWYWVVIALGFVFNLWWIQAVAKDGGTLRVGYYAWVASYALIAYGLLRLSRTESTPNPIPDSPV